MIEIKEFGMERLLKEDKFHYVNNLQSRVMKALRRLTKKEVGTSSEWTITHRNSIRTELDHVQRMIDQLHTLILTKEPYISDEVWAAKYNLIESSLNTIEDDL